MTAAEVERLLVASVETMMTGGPTFGSSTNALSVPGMQGLPPGSSTTTAALRPVPSWAAVVEEPPAQEEPPTEVVSAGVPSVTETVPEAERTAVVSELAGAKAAGEAAPVRRRTRRVAVWSVATVVAAAVVAGAVLFVHGHGNALADGTAGDSSGSPSPSPSPSASVPQAPPTAPPGYQLEHDPTGFTMAVPTGWTRKVDAAGVHFVDTATQCELLVSAENFAGPSPYQHFQDLEKIMRAKKNGYVELRLNATTFAVDGQVEPAAIWEWNWTSDNQVEFHAQDLAFGKEGTTEYAVYLSTPESEWPQQQLVFDTAEQTFRPPQ
jgi:eukaryotic-like serine/threonine-protein kinase